MDRLLLQIVISMENKDKNNKWVSIAILVDRKEQSWEERKREGINWWDASTQKNSELIWEAASFMGPLFI
jgi:hypothetical protein